MNRQLRVAVVVAMLLGVAPGYAADVSAPPSARQIPFKIDSTSVEEQGTKIVGVLIALLAVTAGGLFFVRRKLQGSVLSGVLKQRMRVVERLRISSTLTMYLVSFDGREIVFVHGGNSIAQLDLKPDNAIKAANAEGGDA